MRRRSTWNILWFVAFLTLFVALLVYVGIERVLRTIQSAEPRFLLAAFACYATFFLLRGVRWKLLLRPVAPNATVTQAAALTAGGWLVSTYVPFKAGDMARAALMARRHRAGIVSVGGTIALERSLDVIGLAVAASVGLLLAALLAQSLPSTVASAVALAWVLPILGLVALFLLARWIPEKAHENLVMRFAHRFLMAARELRANPRRLPALFGLSVLVTSAQVGIFAFLFHALRPEAPWIPVIAGVPLFLLSFVIAVTPGQVGTYEAAFVAVFMLMGFPREVLLPMAVACHLMTISFVTALGTIGFLSHRIHDAAVAPLDARADPRRDVEVEA